MLLQLGLKVQAVFYASEAFAVDSHRGKQLCTKYRPLSGIMMSISLLEVQTKDIKCESCELTEHRQGGPTVARSLIPGLMGPLSPTLRAICMGHVGSDTEPVLVPKFSRFLLWEQAQAFSMKSVMLACQKWQKMRRSPF